MAPKCTQSGDFAASASFKLEERRRGMFGYAALCAMKDTDSEQGDGEQAVKSAAAHGLLMGWLANPRWCKDEIVEQRASILYMHAQVAMLIISCFDGSYTETPLDPHSPDARCWDEVTKVPVAGVSSWIIGEGKSGKSWTDAQTIGALKNFNICYNTWKGNVSEISNSACTLDPGSKLTSVTTHELAMKRGGSSAAVDFVLDGLKYGPVVMQSEEAACFVGFLM